MAKIADISHYQDTVDWDLARRELDYVIFRASIGLKADNLYVQYANECGVPFGVYHYCKAVDEAGAREEARWFYDCAGMPPRVKPTVYFVDIEEKTQVKANTDVVCFAFLDELKKLGAKKVGIYIGQGKYPWLSKETNDICDCLWIPRYGKDTGEIPPEQYYPIYPCDLWQYTSRGVLAGVDEGVDLNTLHGELPLEWFTETVEEEPKETPKLFPYLVEDLVTLTKEQLDILDNVYPGVKAAVHFMKWWEVSAK